MGKFQLSGKIAGIFLLSGCASTAPRVARRMEAPITPQAPAPKPQVPEKPAAEVAKKEAPRAPAGPQTVTISYDQISTELGIPRRRLEDEVGALAHFMEGRHLPRGFCSADDEDSTEKLCSLVGLIQNNPSANRLRREGGRRVPIRPNHFAIQQIMGYGRLLRSISREPVNRVMVWSARMLATTSCPRNLSAAALRRLESGLPAPSVKHMMEKLYDHASACLGPQDEAFEITHLRQGLLRLEWGNKAGAKAAFERAVQAQDSSDRPRALYWAGRLQPTESLRKKFWDRLIEEYPLSYHALEVWRARNQDPMRIFESRPALTLTRHIDNDDIDNAMRWLEALYVSGRVEPAQKLARWINLTYRDELPPSTAFYISALKSSRGSSLSHITFLTQQVNENPSMLNQQTLRLLFPRPYIDIFERNCHDTDTSLVLAVARQESGFNPQAHSPANAQGLLQLLPSTARRLSGKRRNNLYDSEVNAQLGSKYLNELIEKFSSVELALAAYNAGPGHIAEWKNRFGMKDITLFMDLIPFKETRHYVANIVRNNYWYDRLYTGEVNAERSIASTQKKNRHHSNLVSSLVEAHLSAPSEQLATTLTPTASAQGL